jgi:glycosyltransferase involved in cell wall biosynthesis
MLAGRPIVATAVGDIPAVLRDGQAGVLVPPADAAALASAVAAVLSDPARAQRMSAAGAQRAADEYSFDKMVERYVALYAALLARAPGARPFAAADGTPPPLGRPGIERD